MTKTSTVVEFGPAICYSGYRENQSPITQTYPTVEQVGEDLAILNEHWRYLRIYDSSRHAELVLEGIRENGFDMKVMLGADLRAEVNNPNCPWGAIHSDAQLAANRIANSREIDRMVELANHYPEIAFSASIGNEAAVEWNDHMVSVQRLIEFARRVKGTIKQPVTFCDNYVPWTGKLEPLAAELDFISVHTYPVWEYQTVENALDYTRQNHTSVANHYPNKQVVITEAGWTTGSNGRGIEPWNASEELQAIYCRQLVEWSREQQIPTFLFEAFDEPWKGSPDPMEPEKHWGLFSVDRKPKLVMQDPSVMMRPVG